MSLAWLDAEILIKSFLIGLFAVVLHFGLGRKFNLARSLVWNAAAIACLFLPIAAIVLPPIELESPRRSAAPAEVRASPVAPPSIETAAAPADSEPADAAPEPRASVIHSTRPAPATEPPAPRLRSTGPSRRTIVAGALALQALVSLILLARLIAAHVAARRLVARSIPVESEPWRIAFEQLKPELGIRGEVDLLASCEVRVPVVIGQLRPTILIPRDMLINGSDAERIRGVLAHELGHIARSDYFWNALLRCERAIFWPNPCLWLACKLAGQVREQACDQLCVHFLGGPEIYRAVLLEVASESARTRKEMLGMAMARSTQFERRIARLRALPGTSRCRASRPLSRTIAVAVVLCASLAGTLRPASAVHQPAASVAPPAEAKSEGSPEKAKKTQPPAETETKGSVTKSSPVAKPSPRQDAKAEEKPLLADINAQATTYRANAVTIKRHDYEGTLFVTGKLQQTRWTPIQAPFRARLLDKDLAEPGDKVTKGQVIATLDDSELRDEIEADNDAIASLRFKLTAAKSKLEAARANLARDQALESESAAAITNAKAAVEAAMKIAGVARERADQERGRAEIAAAKAAVETANAKHAASSAQLKSDQAQIVSLGAELAAIEHDVAAQERRVRKLQSKAESNKIVAPFEGIVLERATEPGAASDPARGPLFHLAPSDRIRCGSGISPYWLKSIAIGTPVRIVGEAYAAPIIGKVSRIDHRKDASGLFPFDAEFPNEQGDLNIGMDVELAFDLYKPRGILAAPAVAIVDDEGNPYCFRIKDGVAVRTPVKLGRLLNNGAVEVTDGIREGDVVMVRCHANLPDKRGHGGFIFWIRDYPEVRPQKLAESERDGREAQPPELDGAKVDVDIAPEFGTESAPDRVLYGRPLLGLPLSGRLDDMDNRMM